MIGDPITLDLSKGMNAADAEPCDRCGQGKSRHAGLEQFCPFYSTYRAAPAAHSGEVSEQEEQRLAGIEARLNSRTPGRWYHAIALPFFGYVASCGDSDEESHYVIPEGAHSFRSNGADRDADFIANAPDDIRWLIDRLRRRYGETNG